MIGAFFSEIGIDLLARFSVASKDKDKLLKALQVEHHWTPKDFQRAHQAVAHADLVVESAKGIGQIGGDFLEEKAIFFYGYWRIRLCWNTKIFPIYYGQFFI